MGTDVIWHTGDNMPTSSALKGLLGKKLETLEIPFGCIRFLAGSIIHRGLAMPKGEAKRLYRMHSFCHVKGRTDRLQGAQVIICERADTVVRKKGKMK